MVHHYRHLACVSAGALAFGLYSAPLAAETTAAVAANDAPAAAQPAATAPEAAQAANDTQIVEASRFAGQRMHDERALLIASNALDPRLVRNLPQ